MNERTGTSRRWVVIATLALTLASGQTALAEVATPADDAGAGGGGATTAGQAAPAHYRDATQLPESLQGARNAASQAVDVPRYEGSQNARSIELIEGKEAPVAVVDVPRYEGSQNARSIELIEGKEAPVELAGPVVGPAPAPF